MKIKEVTRFSIRVFDAVLRLLPQLDPDLKPPTKEYFKKVLSSEMSHFFVCEYENKEIGIFTVVTCIVPTGTKVWIEDVVVDELYRGRGLGCELIRHAIEYARSTGAKCVDLTSKPSRIAANNLYRKCDFVLRDTNVYRYQFK